MTLGSERSSSGLSPGIRRDEASVPDFATTGLRSADTFLFIGPWPRIASLRAGDRDFARWTIPDEFAAAARARQRLPVATGSLAAAVALVLTRCIPLPEAYRAIRWERAST